MTDIHCARCGAPARLEERTGKGAFPEVWALMTCGCSAALVFDEIEEG